MNVDNTKKTLERFGVSPNKALGQNFLANDAVAADIVALANIGGKSVLEIGPGLGVLTFLLAKSAARVVAVEIDSGMVNALRCMSDEQGLNPDIIHADFLKVPIETIEEKLGNEICVVANLPYYVTTQVCMRILKSSYSTESMTLMMQKEAAERILTEHSPVHTLIEFAYDTEIALHVGRDCYYPSPDVDSVVLSMKKKAFDAETFTALKKLVGFCFVMRRKTLQNNLMTGGIPKETAIDAIQKLGKQKSVRAEELTTTELAALARILFVD